MYLGLDLGTSGLKGVLIDEDQRVLAEASAPLSVARPADGWSEQSPADWLVAAEAVMEGVLAAFDGPRVSIGRVFRFPLPADELVAVVMAELDRQEERELERVIAFRSVSDLDRPEVPAYSRAFAARLLAG